MKVCVYGAGTYTKRYLPLIKKKYDVAYLIDESKDKQSKCLFNVPILRPDEYVVNKYPVIIAIKNVISGYSTLMRFNCHKDIYVLVAAGNSCYLFLYDYNKAIDKEAISLCKLSDGFEVKVNNMQYEASRRRCFDMTWRIHTDNGAGPAFCVHKLWLLNEKFGLINNLYTLWPDIIYIPKKSPDNTSIISESWMNIDFVIGEDSVFDSLEEYPILKITRYIELEIIKDYWLSMDKVFNFNEYDIFIVQDNISAYALCEALPMLKNIVVVYHSQGSLHYEKVKSDPYSGEMYDAIQTQLLEKQKKWVFPSKGAADALFETGTNRMKLLKKTCEINVVHSGYQAKEDLNPSEDLVRELENLQEVDITLVTATKLYYSKGVEYIPVILSKLKKQTGLRIRWILIGSGEMEQVVEENIRKYLLSEDYIWYKERFPSQDDLFYIFSLADFYILMHRVSIFDLSILQAMSYGCIPFLSRVGGNFEFCAYDNGILVNVDDNVLNLNMIMANGKVDKSSVDKLKEYNKNIIKEKFSYKKFLICYKNIIESV